MKSENPKRLAATDLRGVFYRSCKTDRDRLASDGENKRSGTEGRPEPRQRLRSVLFAIVSGLLPGTICRFVGIWCGLGSRIGCRQLEMKHGTESPEPASPPDGSRRDGAGALVRSQQRTAAVCGRRVSAGEPSSAMRKTCACRMVLPQIIARLNMNILGEDGQPLWREDLRGVQVDFGPLVTRCTWWPRVDAPLVWLSRHSWGAWLSNYWSLFPVRDA